MPVLESDLEKDHEANVVELPEEPCPQDSEIVAVSHCAEVWCARPQELHCLPVQLQLNLPKAAIEPDHASCYLRRPARIDQAELPVEALLVPLVSDSATLRWKPQPVMLQPWCRSP